MLRCYGVRVLRGALALCVVELGAEGVSQAVHRRHTMVRIELHELDLIRVRVRGRVRLRLRLRIGVGVRVRVRARARARARVRVRRSATCHSCPSR